jgi:diguanylate cyclase (GGDEF)-like protein
MSSASGKAGEAGYPPRLWLLIGGVVALAIPVTAGAAVSLLIEPPPHGRLLQAFVFFLCAFLADLKPVPLDESGSRSVSLAFAFILSAQILFGWQYAVLISALCVLFPQLIERIPLSRVFFNTGVYVLAALASSLPWLVLGSPSGVSPTTLTLWSFAGGAAYSIVNIVLVCCAVSLARSKPFRPLFLDNLRHGGPAFLTMAFLAALAVVLWRSDPTSLILLAGPLVTLTLYQRSTLASQIATRHAHTDSLSGLGNHRAYELELAASLERAEAENTKLALCYLDVDNFKQINDGQGHPTGDAVLQELAGVFGTNEHVRAYRLGGDEFALLLDCGADDATEHVELLRSQISAVRFLHDRNVAISVGVGIFPDHALEAKDLERAADGALYWAKHHGKDRLCVFDPAVVRQPTHEELSRAAARQARLRAAEHLIRAVDIKDTYTGEHSQAVARLVKGIATEMDLPTDVVEQVRLAGLLHDLGKIGLADEILRKPGPLTLQEQKEVRKHPELGFALLEGLDLDPIDNWILHHHEHWNGSGYPHGLAGEGIPLASRIILVADAFDAMCSDRSYRPAAAVDEVLEEIRRMAGHQFDPVVVAALEAHLEQRSEATVDEGPDPAPKIQLVA